MRRVLRVVGILLLLLESASDAMTFMVTTTADSGVGSLRDAIVQANGLGGTDTISFSISGSPPFVISLTSGLPVITDPVIIDGTTQPGFGGSPIVQVNGGGSALGGGGVSGFDLNATACTIRGIVMAGFSPGGILLRGGGGHTVAGNVIQSNVDGGAPFNSYGVSAMSDANTIGGPTVADRNIITGNNSFVGNGVIVSGANNVIQGNYIGPDATGSGGSGTGTGIRVLGSGTSILGNVVSGNTQGGILIQGNSAIVRGNRIGTTANGLAMLPNGGFGISIGNGTINETIGGASPSDGNVISWNTSVGVTVGSTTGILVQGNKIGVDATGTGPAGNGTAAISIGGTTAGNLIGGPNGGGEGNIIAWNQQGVAVSGTAAVGNAILGNAIYANSNEGIFLGNPSNDPCDGDTGPNDLQNVPVLTAVLPSGGMTTIAGSLNSTAMTTFRLEFFYGAPDGSSPHVAGTGKTLLGSIDVMTDATCSVTFNPTFVGTVPLGSSVTATATLEPAPGVYTDTSQFSTPLGVTPVNLQEFEVE